MRIIAGTHRGRVLVDVGKGDAGAQLRPTSDRVRESLFSMLTHLDVIHGARVLDLFAGTGALGLEALSRGAIEVCFVENGQVGQRLISQNIALLREEGRTKLLRGDAAKLGGGTSPFDLVFLDPPYGKGLGEKALIHLRDSPWLSPEVTIVWEENAPMPAPDGYQRVDRRKYGDTHVTLLQLA